MKHRISILTLIKDRKLFFGSLMLLLTTGVLSGWIVGNNYTVCSSPLHHSFWLNVFFINYTFMGDAFFAVCLAAFFIFYLKRKKTGYALLFAFLFTEAAVQVAKNLLNMYDAGIFVEAGQTIVNHGLQESRAYYHFPSGHTAIAFALATVFLFILKNKAWQLPILCAATLLAYSRIYLAQHSFPDVLTGTVLGTLAGVFSFYLVFGPANSFSKFRNISRICYNKNRRESLQPLSGV
ncbi:hypothetical protein BH11BAC4_BH11BAC4_00090 [soil metagenome]